MTFWMLQGPGWLLVAYLAVAQCLAAFSYDLGVRMGTQEPAATVTPVGAAFWWGLAAADLVFYTPLLAAGLAGHWLGTGWGTVLLAGALGVTAYWPLACLATVWRARGLPGWSLPKEAQYWVALPLIAAWGVWGLWHLASTA